MAEFLFEIGFEEMPAPWLKGLAKQLESKFLELASEADLEPAEPRALWTSRRLVLVARVRGRQNDRVETIWGPNRSVAQDEHGNWTQAARGFAAKNGDVIESIEFRARAGDLKSASPMKYATLSKTVVGERAKTVLSRIAPTLLRSLKFPKRMNWDAWLDDGRGTFEFGRPIQWIVALVDGAVVPITIFDVVNGVRGALRLKSGRRSRGHRFFPRGRQSRSFAVRSFADLENGLAARGVVLDPDKRLREIGQQLEAIGTPSGAGHLAESSWRDLVESPAVVVGDIPREFRGFSPDVLGTVLTHHQNAMLYEGPDGPKSRFAAIADCDGSEHAMNNIRRGLERVVIARLKDARFFDSEDRKHALAEHALRLGDIVFHRDLGTYADKVNRLLAGAALLPGSRGNQEALSEAIKLCKADLSTLMVREFPELQGFVGGAYAPKEPHGVAMAIRWHYHPISPTREKDPPGLAELDGESRDLFARLSLLDKLDSIAGYFLIGAVPSGSSDPLGIRRAGQGVVRVLLDFWQGPTPHPGKLAAEMAQNYWSRIPGIQERTGDASKDRARDVAKNTVEAPLAIFFKERLKAVFLARGYGSDQIDAVFAARRIRGGALEDLDPLEDLPDTARRLEALARAAAEFPDVFSVVGGLFKRAKNIAGAPNFLVGRISAGVPGHLEDFTHVDPSLLEHPAEIALSGALFEINENPETEPLARLRQIAGVGGRITAFFDGVLVNDEREDVQRNRKHLLQILLTLIYSVADLSKLASPAGDSATSS